ncbi:alpha/beta hydrolase [Psychrobacter sp. Choline-02u-13]|nr:alpha/beta hydrolase [Psychrobacter sp. Urea-trap-18]MBA6285461.1 alpha/beta hydrolase [Psychrobacter sp. Urea-trap-16]MBA6319019.1 alpha/beta hydrolase [Psychrobacter sp. Urea-trap-20]MBA6335038.1 alpha/beta hydrolase [Psychrobacter sp. Urea-trap-19]PKG59733.1 alpha/beta hydrolase [Psychrobacter sp. Choline-3u-12]PKG67516.1 alpha/beta hydrolase [Psychrobacter sp. Choline-02u-13]PKH48648.1 alpha/beta hydrolase [Psychrobacter sp. Choline-02u-9]TEW87200.1 alpha/beta hydrolase [Psychrobacter
MPIASLMLLAAAVLLPACSTVTVDKQASAKTISAQRGNIVTDNALSSDTASALLSAGLNEQACMQQFDLCLTQLSDSMLNRHYRPALAIFAELHYAKARQLSDSKNCRNSLARPPLDPYYANAPLSNEDSKTQQEETDLCLTDYQARLFDAVKYSYTYLFYDSLTHDFEGAEQNSNSHRAQNRIPNDNDIQTQDIYNAASNDVITQIYQSTENANKLMGDTTVEYLPITSTKRDNTDEAAIANRPPLKGKATDQVKVMKVTVDDYNLDIYLPNENNYLQNAHKQTSALADLSSTYELRLSGLNSVSKRPGLGISLVASLDDRYTTTIRQLLVASLSGRLTNENKNNDDSEPSSRIYPTGHLLLTGLIKPDGDSVLDALSSRKLDIHLYNPYQTESVNILNDDYPLAANFSAGYGLWLSENQLDGVGYLNLITRQPDAQLPKLFMLEPYDPDKRVLIMLHGLASSPATWVNLTNDILNDDKLRDNYQVWQIFYPTNLPILENRYQIQQLINSTYRQTDPNGQNRASRNSVIISHSMGAIIARMMLSDENLVDDLDKLNDKDLLSSNEKQQIRNALKTSFGENELKERFELQALPQVDTAVFLSAPFRGTDYADRWFTRALRRIVYLPVGLVKTFTDNLATIATQGDLAQNPLGALYLQNGASQLSDKSSFIELTKDITMNERITYHSIIANNDADITKGLAQTQPNGAKIDLSQAVEDNAGNETASVDVSDNTETSQLPPEPLVAAVTVNDDISQALTERLSDGIVPYNSAHLDGAASETIINGGHSIQTNPQTILTLRRILHKQLQE